jgi:hypothetical protein
MQILAMNHEIESQRDALALYPPGDAQLLGVSSRSGKLARGFFFGALKTQLEVIESRSDEFLEALLIQRKARSDHARVQAGGARGTDNLGQIRACERLAPGEVGLQHTEFGCFAQDARPGCGGKFPASRCQFHRIRTVDTVQRAAMSQLSDKSQRIGNCRTH